jgi:peptidoglycan/LPS O-acetylase OafA/YrhL
LAYLLFPFLFPVLWRAGPAAKAGLGGLLVVALGWLAYRTGGYFNQWNGTYAILRCLPEFLPECCCIAAIRAAFSPPCWPPTRRSRQ